MRFMFVYLLEFWIRKTAIYHERLRCTLASDNTELFHSTEYKKEQFMS